MNIVLANIKAERVYKDETWAQYLGEKPKNYIIAWSDIRFRTIDYEGDPKLCLIRARNRARRLLGNFWEFYCTVQVPLKIEHDIITVLSPLHFFRFNHNYAYDRAEIPPEMHVVEFDFRARKVRMRDPLYKESA